jgi:hypothetical protein
MKLPSAEALAVIAIVAALVVCALTIWATRRWGKRRNRLLFEYNSAALIPHRENPTNLLKVTYRDMEVAEPHLVTIRLRNVGPSDIATPHFDDGRPITIRLNAVMYGLTGGTYPVRNIVSSAVGADGELSVGPHLLRRNEEWIFEAVVQGDARPELDSPLVDTDVVDPGAYYMAQTARAIIWQTLMGALEAASHPLIALPLPRSGDHKSRP